jgi:hypothetical protein
MSILPFGSPPFRCSLVGIIPALQLDTVGAAKDNRRR